MKKYFVISIDVEPDCSKTWHYSNPLTFTGVTDGIKNHLQPLFNKYNVKPTYLINNVVLENAESVDTFNNLEGQFELGTHLHPEFIEPKKTVNNYAGVKAEGCQCFYDPDTELKKLENITKLFEQCFNYKPISFRAGRYCFGQNTQRALIKLGYKIDTSITPHKNWSDKSRAKPIDFRNAPNQPYFMGDEGILQQSNEGELLEVPISIRKTFNFTLRKNLFKCFHRKIQWLRPSFNCDIKDIEPFIKYMLKKRANCEIVIYNIMFHNIEVLPRINRRNQTKEDCVEFIKYLETFFNLANKYNIKSTTLSELHNVYRTK